MMPSSRLWWCAVVIASVTGAFARPDEPPPPGPSPTPPPADPAPPDDPDALPSLDDLLGLDDEKPKSDDDSQQSELDRELRDEQAGDDFSQAVNLLDQVAQRLEKNSDTGLATQRMQEEAVKRLDKLISEARKQRQNRQQQKKRQQQQQQQDQPQKSQQQQQSQTQSTSNQNAQNQGAAPDQGRQDGAVRQVTPGGTAAWGNLPDHVRSSLMQGFSDRFSSMYQAMTEAYYRRLAEDRSKPAGSASPEGGR